MITVADIIALPVFESIEPIAPCDGAGGRVVHNVGIMDTSPNFDGYAVYHPGEFILTNLGFVEDADPDECERAVVAMLRRGVSGIAIKCVYGATITDGMREASMRLNIPVYVYTGAFHEMVAYQALGLIDRDAKAAVKNAAIDALIAPRGGRRTRDAVQEVTGLLGASVRCVAAAPFEGERLSLYAVLSNLSSALERLAAQDEGVEGTHACLYRDSLLVFVSYSSLADGRDIGPLLRVIRSVAHLRCACGQEVPFSDGDLTIRQATMLLDLPLAEGEVTLSWEGLGEEAFSLAAGADRLFAQTARLYEERLLAIDRSTGSELHKTARAFVDSFGDVKAAALKLYQHPNTVRYRLRKIRQVLGIPSATDRELVRFLSIVFLV